MDDRVTPPEHDERPMSLHTYLHDHAAGAQQAIQMLRELSDHYVGSSLGGFAIDLLYQVEEDLQTLEGLSTSMGTEGLQAKKLAGWLAEKLSHLKLSPLGIPFHTFETLEFLSLGILGKRALWKALASVAPFHPELENVDFDLLVQRAEAQHAATERMRLQLAAQVF